MNLLDHFGLTKHLAFDLEAAHGGRHARATGRSWWSLRYMDGHVVREWDRDAGSANGHLDWPRLAQCGALKGTQALRLYCPNGKMAHLELPTGGDATGRLFQFKIAVRNIAVSSAGASTLGREVLGHVVGVITGLSGACILFAWEPLPEPMPPHGGPPEPRKPDYLNREQPTWALKEQHERYVAERAQFNAFVEGDAMREWARACREWELSARGRMVGPISDNVYDLRYQNVGRLNADHLGIADGEGR